MQNARRSHHWSRTYIAPHSAIITMYNNLPPQPHMTQAWFFVLSSSSRICLCLDKFRFKTSNFLISSRASKSPLDNLSYVSSYFPVDNGALPLILFLMSKNPFRHSMNARKLATHNSGNSFFNSGSVRHSFGVFLWMSTQGDLCRQMARAFFWSLQL